MSGKEFKVVLLGAFGSGRTTFASQLAEAKNGKTKIASMKAEIFPLVLYTSAGQVTLQLYDTTIHAKGGLPGPEFFRQSDAAICFYDITKQNSYDALEEWYDAVQSNNGRKGSAPLPVRLFRFLLEVSSKANYHVKELLMGICKALLGASTQLTDEIEFGEATAKVDEEAADKARKEYADAK